MTTATTVSDLYTNQSVKTYSGKMPDVSNVAGTWITNSNAGDTDKYKIGNGMYLFSWAKSLDNDDQTGAFLYAAGKWSPPLKYSADTQNVIDTNASIWEADNNNSTAKSLLFEGENGGYVKVPRYSYPNLGFTPTVSLTFPLTNTGYMNTVLKSAEMYLQYYNSNNPNNKTAFMFLVRNDKLSYLLTKDQPDSYKSYSLFIVPLSNNNVTSPISAKWIHRIGDPNKPQDISSPENTKSQLCCMNLNSTLYASILSVLSCSASVDCTSFSLPLLPDTTATTVMDLYDKSGITKYEGSIPDFGEWLYQIGGPEEKDQYYLGDSSTNGIYLKSFQKDTSLIKKNKVLMYSAGKWSSSLAVRTSISTAIKNIKNEAEKQVAELEKTAQQEKEKNDNFNSDDYREEQYDMYESNLCGNQLACPTHLVSQINNLINDTIEKENAEYNNFKFNNDKLIQDEKAKITRAEEMIKLPKTSEIPKHSKIVIPKSSGNIDIIKKNAEYYLQWYNSRPGIFDNGLVTPFMLLIQNSEFNYSGRELNDEDYTLYIAPINQNFKFSDLFSSINAKSITEIDNPKEPQYLSDPRGCEAQVCCANLDPIKFKAIYEKTGCPPFVPTDYQNPTYVSECIPKVYSYCIDSYNRQGKWDNNLCACISSDLMKLNNDGTTNIINNVELDGWLGNNRPGKSLADQALIDWKTDPRNALIQDQYNSQFCVLTECAGQTSFKPVTDTHGCPQGTICLMNFDASAINSSISDVNMSCDSKEEKINKTGSDKKESSNILSTIILIIAIAVILLAVVGGFVVYFKYFKKSKTGGFSY